MGYPPGAGAQLAACLETEGYISVVSCIVGLAILCHSAVINGRTWKHTRWETEVAASSLLVGGATLIIAYPMREGLFVRRFLIESIAQSLNFVIIQAVDNLQLLECAEMAGGKIKKPWVRYGTYLAVSIVMFFWFPVYFLRAFLPAFFESPKVQGFNAFTLWYWLPAMCIYNAVLGLYFILQILRLGAVRSSQQGKMYVLAFKSIIRILISTLGATLAVTLEGLASSQTLGSFLYMILIPLTSHVLFNTRLFSDELMHSVLFRNLVFAAEAALTSLQSTASPRSGALSSPGGSSKRNLASPTGLTSGKTVAKIVVVSPSSTVKLEASPPVASGASAAVAVTVPGDVEQGRSEVTNVLHKTADTKERQASGSAAARAAATKEEDDDVTLLEDIEDGNDVL